MNRLNQVARIDDLVPILVVYLSLVCDPLLATVGMTEGGLGISVCLACCSFWI